MRLVSIATIACHPHPRLHHCLLPAASSPSLLAGGVASSVIATRASSGHAGAARTQGAIFEPSWCRGRRFYVKQIEGHVGAISVPGFGSHRGRLLGRSCWPGPETSAGVPVGSSNGPLQTSQDAHGSSLLGSLAHLFLRHAPRMYSPHQRVPPPPLLAPLLAARLLASLLAARCLVSASVSHPSFMSTITPGACSGAVCLALRRSRWSHLGARGDLCASCRRMPS